MVFCPAAAEVLNPRVSLSRSRVVRARQRAPRTKRAHQARRVRPLRAAALMPKSSRKSLLRALRRPQVRDVVRAAHRRSKDIDGAAVEKTNCRSRRSPPPASFTSIRSPTNSLRISQLDIIFLPNLRLQLNIFAGLVRVSAPVVSRARMTVLSLRKR